MEDMKNDMGPEAGLNESNHDADNESEEEAPINDESDRSDSPHSMTQPAGHSDNGQSDTLMT